MIDQHDAEVFVLSWPRTIGLVAAIVVDALLSFLFLAYSVFRMLSHEFSWSPLIYLLVYPIGVAAVLGVQSLIMPTNLSRLLFLGAGICGAVFVWFAGCAIALLSDFVFMG